MTEVPRDLPGANLVLAGVSALRRGELTVEALLVAIGARRLRAAGLQVPQAPGLPDSPELALYAALGAAHPRDAHSRYNALIRRLVSFERALERLAATSRNSRSAQVRRESDSAGATGRSPARERPGSASRR